MNVPSTRQGRSVWRLRWAALGAAVTVSLGGGGLFVVSAGSGTPSSFVSIDPVRILDTRDPTNIGLAGPFVSATALDLVVTGSVPTTTGTKVVVPTGATAVSMNVTVVNPTANGFVSIRPADATGPPAVSSLNFKVGDIVPNAVTVQLPTAEADQGRIEITFDAYGTVGPTTDILIDAVGYYTASATTSASTASGEYLGPPIDIAGPVIALVSATLTPPADGKISVIADAEIAPGVLESAAGGGPGRVSCGITTGPLIDLGHEIGVSRVEGTNHISGVRTFDVIAGQTATYQLNCTSSASTVGAKAYNAHVSVIFTAAA